MRMKISMMHVKTSQPKSFLKNSEESLDSLKATLFGTIPDVPNRAFDRRLKAQPKIL